jgi:hypothetical protein
VVKRGTQKGELFETMSAKLDTFPTKQVEGKLGVGVIRRTIYFTVRRVSCMAEGKRRFGQEIFFALKIGGS